MKSPVIIPALVFGVAFLNTNPVGVSILVYNVNFYRIGSMFELALMTFSMRPVGMDFLILTVSFLPVMVGGIAAGWASALAMDLVIRMSNQEKGRRDWKRKPSD